MEINCTKGDNVMLTDNCCQTFIGVVKSVNQNLGRVVLSNVYQLPEYKELGGYRNFDKNEILEIKKTDTSKVYTGGSNNIDPVKLTKLPEPESKSDPVKKKFETKYIYIRNDGTNFESAVSLLKNTTVIGVVGKDVSKGRFGRASVLAVSTPSKTFVFDLKALENDILEKGLKEVLESSVTVKVVYDCRLLSDCLKHQHLISLENVRDVEAEDVIVLFQDRRMIRRHSRSLEYLARVYLGVEMEERNDTGDMWNERPLRENLLEDLVSQASILLPLQEAIERKYFQKFIDASGIYNAHVRSLDFVDAVMYQPKRTLRAQIINLLLPQNHTRSRIKL